MDQLCEDLSSRVQGLNLFGRVRRNRNLAKEKKKKGRCFGVYTFARVDPDPGARDSNKEIDNCFDGFSGWLSARFQAARLAMPIKRSRIDKVAI